MPEVEDMPRTLSIRVQDRLYLRAHCVGPGKEHRRVEIALQGNPLAHALPFGLLLSWDGSSLAARRTTSDYTSLTGDPVPIAAGLPRQWLGFCYDRRETAWLAGMATGSTLKVCYSRDWGLSGWTELP